MRFISLVFLVFVVNVNAGNIWLKDLISPKGWDLGYGVNLKLNERHKGRNVPIMDRLSLDLNLGDLVGISVGKARSEGVELDFYVNKDVDYREGRARRQGWGGGRYVIPMVIGYKLAVVGSAILGLMQMLTMTSMVLAKGALIVSMLALFVRSKARQRPGVVEVEQHGFPSLGSGHVPYYPALKGTGSGLLSYGGGWGGAYGGGFDHFNFGNEEQASKIYNNIAYRPTASGNVGAESNNAYVSATPSESGMPAISVARKGRVIERRRDNYFRKMKDATENDSMLVKKYASKKTDNR